MALIGAVVWGMVYHLQNDTFLLAAAGKGRGAIAGLMMYLSPLLVGGIMVFFMVKPFFARQTNFERGRSLTRKGEPLLFAFVDRICDVVGAPPPVRIDIDGQVNASASFRRGLWSLFGHDLVLTIGMPLVAGMNLRDFGGVLAHEFGHFSQGAGMRLSYVIRRSSNWLTRVVYERDSWDEWLVNTSQGLDLRIGWVFYLAMLSVWLTRKILWVFMVLGHVTSSYLLRQMEFDADRHAARVTGTESFINTSQRLCLLGVARERALSDLGEYYREGRLTDNLPLQIVASIPLLPPGVQQALQKHLAETPTGWLDTHPADRDRIAAVRRENSPGIFHLTCPATDLFVDFAAASQGVTMDLYREAFGSRLDPEAVRPLAELMSRQAEQQQSEGALGRYAQGLFSVTRPILLPSGWLEPSKDPKASLALIKRARTQVLDSRESYEQSAADFDLADSRLVEVEQAAALLDAELKIKAKQFVLPLTCSSEVRAQRKRLTADRERASGELASIQTLLGQRLLAAFQLLSVKQVVDRLPEAGEWQSEGRDLLALAFVLIRQHSDTLKVRDLAASLSALTGQLQPQESRQPLIKSLVKHMRQAAHAIGEVRGRLEREQYPFDHVQGSITVADYVLPSLPSNDDLGAVLNACSTMLEALGSLQFRLFSRLSFLAERIEQALGLPPLPEPVKDTPPADVPHPEFAVG